MVKQILSRMLKDVKAYIGIAVVIGVYYVLMHVCFDAFCPLLMVTGFPCAGCGMTRAVLFVVSGQFSRAFYINPIAFLIVIFAVYCGICRYICGVRVKGFKAGIAILAVLLLGLYICRMYLYFPERIPYVYTRGNFIEKMIPAYYTLVKRLFF